MVTYAGNTPLLAADEALYFRQRGYGIDDGRHFFISQIASNATSSSRQRRWNIANKLRTVAESREPGCNDLPRTGVNPDAIVLAPRSAFASRHFTD